MANVLITGCSSGFGLLTARQFARKGDTVFASMRNTTAVSDAPAVPLSEVTDLTAKADETTPRAMPKIEFQYDGRPDAMRTYIVEPGAAPPAPAPQGPPPAAPPR